MSVVYSNTNWKEGKEQITGKQYQLEKRAFDKKYSLSQTGHHRDIVIHHNEDKTQYWLTFQVYAGK